MCVVFWINLVRHIGMQIPATEFSKTTDVLPAGLTIHGAYIDEFVPAAITLLLSGYFFTADDNASPERLTFLKASVASIRGELCGNVPHRRQSEGLGRKPRRTPEQLARELLVPLPVAVSEEDKDAVRARVVEIVHDISDDVPSWFVFLEVWLHAPELEQMGIQRICTDACRECCECYKRMRAAQMAPDLGDGTREANIAKEEKRYKDHRDYSDGARVTYNSARDECNAIWRSRVPSSLLKHTSTFTQAVAMVDMLPVLFLSGDFMKSLYTIHYTRAVKVSRRRR
jgi:hypothetical protein